MQPKKHILAAFSILMIAALLAACGSPAAAPTATAVPPTATPVPPAPEPTAAVEAPATVPPAATGKIESEKGEITSQALAGNLLDDPMTRDFYVLLPPGYATSDKRYPVVYMLHWYTGDASALVPRTKKAYQDALNKGDLQEMIFVFPDAHNKLDGSFYLSSPTIGDYETYITSELVDLVDATYRTIPDRNSRGVTGCSMGGDGSLHLALRYPGVFSVAAPTSGNYDWEHDLFLNTALDGVTKLPENFDDILTWFPIDGKVYLALAAAAAPNPNKPPFYLDMPFTIVDGKAQVVPEVFERVIALDPLHDVQNYMSQPERLNAILIMHGKNDPEGIDVTRNFNQQLTDLGIEHEYLEIDAGRCDFSYEPVVKFMSDHLVGEE